MRDRAITFLMFYASPRVEEVESLDMNGIENNPRSSMLHIHQACEESLRHLQTDHIDLYQMHHVDRNSPWEEIWQAM